MRRYVILTLALLGGGCGSSGSDKGAGNDSADKKVQEAAARTTSQNNLKQLGIGFHRHHEAAATFPQAAIFDKTGKPLLSWRVAILPYIEQEALYKQFKLDEPWDSEHNKKLLAQMPRVYAAPALPGLTVEPNHTFYQVFVGDAAPFRATPVYLTRDGKPAAPDKAERVEVLLDWTAKLRVFSFKDGTSNTFLIVEAGEAVPWTKPADVPYFAAGKAPRLGGIFKDRFNAVMADGSTRSFPKDLNEEVLRALITPNGGEVLDLDKDPPVLHK
jgi:hypothetical protein